MAIFLFLYLLALAPAHADSDKIGFQTGNDFKSIFINGEITVNCRDDFSGQSDFAAFRCVGEVLEPAEYARFQGPILNADTVKLNATHEDGSTRLKSEEYNGEKGLSKGRFNLWISTLLQRPLLKFGRNQVDYFLTRNNKVIKSGQFIAEVKSGPERSCSRLGQYNSNDLNDCRFSQNLCSRYFEEENYCEERKLTSPQEHNF